jgi:5,10-methenyltetrahydrofolate synthetase
MRTKENLRTDIKQWLRALSIDEVTNRSKLTETQLLQYLVSLDHQSPLSVIGLYLPLRGEPRFEMNRWSLFPWKLAYPSETETGMRYLLPMKQKPEKGHWVEEGEEVKPDVIVVPGLLFSESGYRIGRGGGYYDKLLSSWRPKLGCVGLCFDEQVSIEFETQPHDEKMNVIVTEKRIISVNS